MVKEKDGRYQAPDGQAAPGETAQQTAAREFAEETGYGLPPCAFCFLRSEELSLEKDTWKGVLFYV